MQPKFTIFGETWQFFEDKLSCWAKCSAVETSNKKYHSESPSPVIPAKESIEKNCNNGNFFNQYLPSLKRLYTKGRNICADCLFAVWQQLCLALDFICRLFEDGYKRKAIFRDIEQAHTLAKSGFSKPAVILAGSVIEELLRLYLEANNVTAPKNTFDEYIKTCDQNGFLKGAISRLSDSVRHFRNLVHLEGERSGRHKISKATATSAVASIFIILNDFQKEN